MNQKLIKQIRNEWRSNVWLVVELTVISVVLWYVVDYLYVTTSVYNEPRGFDISHCYRISVGQLSKQHPDFIRDRKPRDVYNDYEELRRRIAMRPEVEAAALSMNATPYNGNNSGTQYLVDSIWSQGYVFAVACRRISRKCSDGKGLKGKPPPDSLKFLMRATCSSATISSISALKIHAP